MIYILIILAIGIIAVWCLALAELIRADRVTRQGEEDWRKDESV